MFQVGEGKLLYSNKPKQPVKPPKDLRTIDNLPTLLRTYRQKHNLSQEALAKLVGAHKQTIYGYECGIKPIFVYAKRIKALLRKDAKSTSCANEAVAKAKANYFRSIESACDDVDKSEKL